MTKDSGPLCDEPEDDADAGADDGGRITPREPNEVHILAVPGLAKQSSEFIAKLAALAVRNGWDPDGIAAVISHESRFQPSAKSPNSSATGLIQFIESTARTLGTTTAALAAMSAVEQLPFVEGFFRRFMPRVPDRPEDYILVTYGRSDAVGKGDDFVLDRRDSDDRGERARYAANSTLDTDNTGAITAGDLRRSIERVLSAAHGQYVHTLPWTSSSAAGAAGAAIVLTLLVFGEDIVRAAREVFR